MRRKSDISSILEGCIRGDAKCQRQLYELYCEEAFGICRRYARNDQEAEDMLQSAFVNIYRFLHKFEGRGSFSSWIRKVIVHNCLVYLKQHRHMYRNIEISDQHYATEVADSAFSHLEKEDLLKMVQQLPDGYREVFNLFAIEGYSHREIAAKLGIAESTSRSQLTKARRLLRNLIIKSKNLVL